MASPITREVSASPELLDVSSAESTSRDTPLTPEQAALVAENYDLALMMANKVIRSTATCNIGNDDVISDATFGIIDAARKFDPTRGIKFQTYASRRIKGEIIDGMRARTLLPRSVMINMRAIREQEDLGRSDDEICAELNMPLDKLQESRRIYNDHHIVFSLDFDLSANVDESIKLGDTLSLPDSGTEEIVMEQLENKLVVKSLKQALSLLPPRHVGVLWRYYFEGRCLQDIANEYGLTESRMCQVHTEAVALLRQTIESHFDPDFEPDLAPKQKRRFMKDEPVPELIDAIVYRMAENAAA